MQLAAVTWQLWQCELEISKPISSCLGLRSIRRIHGQLFPATRYSQNTFIKTQFPMQLTSVTWQLWHCALERPTPSSCLGLRSRRRFHANSLRNHHEVFQNTSIKTELHKTCRLQLCCDSQLWQCVLETFTPSLCFLPEKQKTFSQLALTCHEGTPKHIHQRTNGYFMFFF